MNENTKPSASTRHRMTREDDLPLPILITDPSAPLLIEGHLEGNLVEVALPSGERWKYTAGDMTAAPLTVLVWIDPATPETASMHRPTAEGIHPFIAKISRFGVERSEA